MDATLFLEQFAPLAQAPNGVQTLRSLILELAVRGKLVEQDPADEPASVLLQRIEAEKQRRIQAGELKPAKPLPPISYDEYPYELPPRWAWVRFGEITFNRDSERIPISKEERQTLQGEYPYYGASGIIDFINDYIFDKSLLLIGEDGANLLARSTPIAFIAHGKYWVNNHAHVIDGYNHDFLRYMEVFINAINLEPYVTGTAQPKMNQAKMNSIPVCLPPLAEQQRIVAKVDELMALCDQLEAEQTTSHTLRTQTAQSALHHLTSAPSRTDAWRYWQDIAAHFPALFDDAATVADLRAAILQLAVQGRLVPQHADDEPASALLQRIEAEKQRRIQAGELKPSKPLPPVGDDEQPYDLPPGWVWVRLGQITNYGETTKVEPHQIHDTYLWILDLEDIEKVTSRVIQKIRSHERQFQSTKNLFHQGDILYGKLRPYLDKVVVADETGICTTEIIPFNSFNIINNYYLRWFLKSSYFINYAVNSTHGMNLPRLGTDKARLACISLPPLAEQQRIVAKVDELMALCDQLEAHATGRQALGGQLLGSLVYHLFSSSETMSE